MLIRKIVQLTWLLLLSVVVAPAQALIITDELEALRVFNVGTTFQTVNSQQTYTDMIVVCTYAMPSAASLEALVRIDNITTSSFDIRIQNPGNSAAVTAADVYCILADEGDWTLPDGTVFDAHKVDAEETLGRRLTIEWNQADMVDVSADLMGSYGVNDQPAVLGQVMSYDDTDFSLFISSDCEDRENLPFDANFADGLCVGKHVGEEPNATGDRETETVGYVVVEQAIGSFDGISYRSAVGPATVEGVDNSPPYVYPVGLDYDVGAATMMGSNGRDGGWVVFFGADPFDGTNIDLAIAEDTIQDAERRHAVEEIAYWIFSGTDYSDAPISYGSASHKVTGTLSLGASADGDADAELSAQVSAAANGDDLDGFDDENGVVFRSPATTGDSIFADVEVSNPTGLAVTVCAWLDIPSTGGVVDGTFDTSDGSCQSTSLVNPTLEFQWSGLPTDQVYTTFTRFRVTSDAMTAANATSAVLAEDGEVEDYQVVLDFTPTAVTIGQVNINSIAIANFLTGVGTDDIDTQGLFDLLQNIDPSTTLEPSASQAEIEKALNDYLDPDEDGQVIVFSWDTLEQRGSIGFYAERRQPDGSWYRINDSLLPAIIAAPMGAEYQLVDRTASLDQADSATGNYEYRLIELEANGAMREYGPFNLSL